MKFAVQLTVDIFDPSGWQEEFGTTPDHADVEEHVRRVVQQSVPLQGAIVTVRW